MIRRFTMPKDITANQFDDWAGDVRWIVNHLGERYSQGTRGGLAREFCVERPEALEEGRFFVSFDDRGKEHFVSADGGLDRIVQASLYRLWLRLGANVRLDDKDDRGVFGDSFLEGIKLVDAIFPDARVPVDPNTN